MGHDRWLPYMRRGGWLEFEAGGKQVRRCEVFFCDTCRPMIAGLGQDVINFMRQNNRE